MTPVLATHSRWDELEEFEFDGEPFKLRDRQRGIRTPRKLTAALSITTTYTPPSRKAPYADEMGAGTGSRSWRCRSSVTSRTLSCSRSDTRRSARQVRAGHVTSMCASPSVTREYPPRHDVPT